MRHCTQCGSPTPDDARFCPRCGTAVAAGNSGDPMLGKVITDRYLLIEKIGQGGSGTIYRGEHTTLRKKVAVKILHAQLSTDDTALERFRREATTVAELDNDHILQVLDFGRTDDNRLFFAMEYLEGETLTKLLERDKKLPVPRAIDILTQTAEALMEAHGLGYVHRDLRPRNVFLINKRGRTDFVKLLDFGLAKLILPNSEAKQTAMGMTFGDPRYMSPEQARGDTLDRRSDIYSLGAIAFEMLTGTPPYSGSGTFEILQQHLDAPVPRVRDRRPDCPEWLDAVVLRALAKQREGRFLTVLKMLECLRSQMAPPVADAAEKAAHAQLSAQGAGEPSTAKAGPTAQTLMGAAPAVPRAATPAPPATPAAAPPAQASPAMAHAATEPHREVKPAPSPSVAHSMGPPPTPQASALAASVAPTARPSPASSNPKETQALTTLKANTVPGAQPAPSGKKQAKKDARRPPPSNQPASAVAGSVEVTPSSLKAPDANVPSVVVEAGSHDKTLPERPAPRVDQTPASLPPPPSSDKSGKQDRPPTGEWFSAEAAQAGAGYDDELDDVPRANRAPLIIGGVVGGLGLIVVAVIALLPKPQHKPLRGEEALSQGATSKPTPAGAATTPSGAAAIPTPSPTTASGATAAATPVPASGATAAASSTTASGVTAANPTAANPTTANPTAATPTAANPTTAHPTASASGATAAKAGATTPSGATAATTPAASSKPAVAAKPAPAVVAKAEKPRPAAIAPVEKPVVAERPRDKPKAEKPEKIEKAPTRVASAERASEKPSPASDKHKKPVPEGFKDPFSTDPSGGKPANDSAQAEFFIKLGRQKLNADELGAAAANFTKAREYDSRSAEAIAGLGEVAFEQGDYNGAAVHLKQALRIAPNRPRYLVLLGQAYYKLGKAKEAVGEYKKALRVDPGNAEAQHSLEVAERKLNGG